MKQTDIIKDIARFSLGDDRDQLIQRLNELVEYSIRSKKTNFAVQLQSIIKDAVRRQDTQGALSLKRTSLLDDDDKDVKDLILEKLTSDYTLDDLICSDDVKQDLKYFLAEHKAIDMLSDLDLPTSNKILLHGPSGCGKTLTSYVISGEMKKIMYVVNLGAIVSSKLGETSRNLAKLFKKASEEESIIFLDEFDSLGKIRDYDQDHGEMKRVVNTILQLFDFLPQKSVVIAATNQANMIDEALLRRFDLNLNLERPNKQQIRQLVNNTLKNKNIIFDNKSKASKIIDKCVGLSYYVIQHSLLTALKRSIINLGVDMLPEKIKIETAIWEDLIKREERV